MNKQKIRMGRGGAIFSVYLPIFTLVMCGVCLLFFSYHQKDIENSVVSPISVIELENNMNVFEFGERGLLIYSAKESGVFENGDIQTFKDVFISELLKDNALGMRKFLFSNLVYEQKKLDINDISLEQQKTFFNTIYDVKIENGKLEITRGELTKFMVLVPQDRNNKNNFLVDFEYKFKKDFAISEEDLK
jgi:hypothetical protein